MEITITNNLYVHRFFDGTLQLRLVMLLYNNNTRVLSEDTSLNSRHHKQT